MRSSRKSSKGSLGQVERFHQTVKALTRVLKAAVERKFGCTLALEGCIIPWLLLLASSIYMKFLKGEDGRAPWHRIHGVPYSSKWLTPCEVVDAKINDLAYIQAQLENRTIEGVWVGRSGRSDEHIVLTEKGLLQTRAVRRRDEHHRYQLEVLNKAKGVP